MVLEGKKKEEENKEKRSLQPEKKKKSLRLKIKVNRGALNWLVAKGKEWEERNKKIKTKKKIKT